MAAAPLYLSVEDILGDCVPDRRITDIASHISRFPWASVHRLCPDTPRSHLVLCAQFFVLKVLCKDYHAKVMSPTEDIDAVWHTVLLFPAYYVAMCHAALNSSELIIDHNPLASLNDYESHSNKEQRRATFANMYEHVFRKPLDRKAQGPLVQPGLSEHEPVIRIIVLTQSQDTMLLTVSKTSVLQDIKALISTSRGIPAEQQRLIFDGKQLADERTMTEYSVPDYAVFHLVLRLTGC